MLWLPVSLAVVVVWRISLIIYRRWFHPLSKFPGPFFASVTTLYRIYWFIHGSERENLCRLHAKYGPVVRYAPDALLFDDPTLVPAVYHPKCDKTDLYAANFGSVTTFTMMSHKDHIASRRRISHWYALDTIKPFEEKVNERLRELLNILKRTSTTGQPINVLYYMNLTAFDVIGQFCFGHHFGFLQHEKDAHDLIKNLAQTVWYLEFLAICEPLSWFVRNTGIGRYFLMCRPTDKGGIGAVMRVRDRVLEETLGQDVETKATTTQGSLLGGFLTSHNADGTAMAMDDIKAELLTAMQAGSETTSFNLALILFHVGRNPEIQKRLQEELDEAESDGRISSKDTIVDFRQAQELPYLSACVRESLRFSASHTDMPRRTPGKELMLAGHVVPPDTSVASSAWIVGRDQKLFGDDADIYRPERWIEASPEQRKLMDRYDLTFGYGARQCLGRHLARMQLWKLSAEVFRSFNVKVVQPTIPSVSGIPASWEMSFHTRPSGHH